jgi:hypothetical protein
VAQTGDFVPFQPYMGVSRILPESKVYRQKAKAGEISRRQRPTDQRQNTRHVTTEGFLMEEPRI